MTTQRRQGHFSDRLGNFNKRTTRPATRTGRRSTLLALPGITRMSTEAATNAHCISDEVVLLRCSSHEAVGPQSGPNTDVPRLNGVVGGPVEKKVVASQGAHSARCGRRLSSDIAAVRCLPSPAADAVRNLQEHVRTCDHYPGLSVDDLKLADLAERFVRPLRIEPDRRLDPGFQHNDVGPSIRRAINRQLSKDRLRVARCQRASHPVPICRTAVRRHLHQ